VTVVVGDPRLADVTKVGERFGAEDLDAVARMQGALAHLTRYRFAFLDDHTTLFLALAARRPAFVLNLCDTGFRNVATRELHVPALLDMLEVPYSGSPPACLAACYDKALVRALAVAHGVPVPREVFVPGCDPETALPVSYPALVKPNTGDGSFGITRDAVVGDAGAARRYLARLAAELPGRDAVVQEFLDGSEYAIALIGNPGTGFTMLPPLEVDYAGLDPALPRILAYESKTIPESPYWRQIAYTRARLGSAALDVLGGHAARLFTRLGCRDYARFDFRAGADGVIRLLEVNPNPAWCWDGKLQLMAGFAGHDESALFGMILGAAQTREARTRGLTNGRAARSRSIRGETRAPHLRAP
jgi:D-alanine-D-alanine ligase